MTARRALFAAHVRHAYHGEDYGWRFSAARSVQCATSDRETSGGMTTRCLPTSRS